MTKVTIHAAKTNLSKLIAQVEAGEEVVICRGDVEVARLMPIAKVAESTGVREEPARFEDVEAWDGESPRKPGRLRGHIAVPDGFYDPWSAKDFSQGIMDDFPDWGEAEGIWDGRSPRKPGRLKGEITLDDTFFDPLSPEETGLAGDER